VADKIVLEGMIFYGFHGASSAEQEVGQRFIVDLEADFDLSAAGQSDDIAATINYSRFFKLAKEILEGPSRKLLENIAENLAQRVLAEYPVDAVRVRVKKPEAPIKGSVLSYAGVDITRRR
jgi:dihydroneopterin aldolase